MNKLNQSRAEGMEIIANSFGQIDLALGKVEYERDGILISAVPKDKDLSTNLQDRHRSRVEFQEAKRQLNIERVVSYAASDLKNEKAVTEKPVDDDWINRFFRVVEDVSKEDMQALWGKILVGEIRTPGCYSLRTLDLLSNLSRREAEVFMKFSKVALSTPHFSFVLYNNMDSIDEYGVSYSDLMVLQEAGLLHSTPSSQPFPEPKIGERFPIIVGNSLILLEGDEKAERMFAPKKNMQTLTTSGHELLNVTRSESSPDTAYIESFLAPRLTHDGYKVKYASKFYLSADWQEYDVDEADLIELPRDKAS